MKTETSLKANFGPAPVIAKISGHHADDSAVAHSGRNIRSFILTAAVLALLAPGARAASPATPDPVTPASKPAAVSSENPESALKRAMPADAVRQIMGKPDEIKPMQAPSGKVEIWVYRRQTNVRIDRVEIGSIPITTSVVGADGVVRQQTVGQTIQYGDQRTATEETVELLMFNDHFLVAKISRRTVMQFE